MLSVLLALPVLSAVVTPLSAGLASGRGEGLVAERLSFRPADWAPSASVRAWLMG